MFSTRSGAARLSLVVVGSLVALKVVFAVLTGSVSILAQALDSLLDVLAVIITFLAIGAAARPADEEHPFGHGKLENLAANAQAVLLFTAAAGIIYTSVRRLLSGETVELALPGAIVMLVSMLASIFLSRHLLRVARRVSSIALEANARNLTADIYTSGGVLVGLVIIYFTGLAIIDPIIALVVAGFIIRAGIRVLWKSLGELIDVRLPEAEEEQIKASLLEHGCALVNFHNLRTRKSGSYRYVDLHLTMPRNITLEEAHRMADHLEQDIKARLPDTSVNIHVEPCDTDCPRCTVSIDGEKRE